MKILLYWNSVKKKFCYTKVSLNEKSVTWKFGYTGIPLNVNYSK